MSLKKPFPGLIKAKTSLKLVMATGIRLVSSRAVQLQKNVSWIHFGKKTGDFFKVEVVFSDKLQPFFQVSSENHLKPEATTPHLKQSSGNCKACGPSLGNTADPNVILPKWCTVNFCSDTGSTWEISTWENMNMFFMKNSWQPQVGGAFQLRGRIQMVKPWPSMLG